MKCHEIHNRISGCEQDIPPGSRWRFCPACGSATGAIRRFAPLECTVELPPAAGAVRSLTLHNHGEAALLVSVGPSAQVAAGQSLSVSPTHLELPAGQRRTISVDIPPTEVGGPIGWLQVTASDVIREPGADPWSARTDDTLRIPLLGRIAEPARLDSPQQALIFGEKTGSRCWRIANTGSTPIEICEFDCPGGYVVSPTALVIPPRATAGVTVSREWALPAPERAIVRARAPGIPELEAMLWCPRPSPTQQRPCAIIGIDFGTACSTVAMREVRGHAILQDPVRFLRPSSEDNDRMPTRIWVEARGSGYQFGSQATQRYEQDPGAGYLLREIKTLLRNCADAEAGAVIYPSQIAHRERCLALLTSRFGDAWGEQLVTQYLAWLRSAAIEPALQNMFGTTLVKLNYVFSLPVLDYPRGGSLYADQRARMETCVARAGFPLDDVSFEFEPACAAIGLLCPPDGSADWPRLGDHAHPVEGGEKLMVFDSGGGTSDMVLATLNRSAADSRITLDATACLGVGSKAETFGGEQITDALLKVLEEPGLAGENITVKDEFDPRQALGLAQDSRFYDVEAFDKADALKSKVAAGHARGATVVEGATISPKLLDHLAAANLDSLYDEVCEKLLDTSELQKVRYYLSVGGNTRLPPVARWMEGLVMGDQPELVAHRRLDLPEEYRTLAVAYGAVWVPDARVQRALAYDLMLCAAHEKLFKAVRGTSSEMPHTVGRVQIAPGDTVKLILSACVGEGWASIDAVTVPNTLGGGAMFQVEVHLQGGVLRVTMRPQQEQNCPAETVLTYAI